MRAAAFLVLGLAACRGPAPPTFRWEVNSIICFSDGTCQVGIDVYRRDAGSDVEVMAKFKHAPGEMNGADAVDFNTGAVLVSAGPASRTLSRSVCRMGPGVDVKTIPYKGNRVVGQALRPAPAKSRRDRSRFEAGLT